MNKKRIFLIAIMFIGIIIAIFFYINSLNYETTDDAYIESDLVQVSTKVSGQIDEIYIKDNQKVFENELVAKIDDRDYKIKLEQAQAQYEKALYAQKSARAKLLAIKTELNAAEKDLKRHKKLYDAGAVSEQAFENIQAKYDSIKAKLTSAQEDILSSSNDKTADANLRALKAQMDIAALYLEYTNIKSPLSGNVTNKNVDKGKFVQTGQPLFTIVSDNLWIKANFKENQVGKMRIGQEVIIKIDAYPKKIFKGRIESIQKATGAKSSLFPPENAVGSFVKIVQRIPVKIIFTEDVNTSEYNIVAGMSVVPKVKIK